MEEPRRGPREWTMGCIGGLMLLGAIPCFAVSFDLLITGEIGAGVMTVLMAAALGIPALFLIRQLVKKPKHKPLKIDETLERTVLGLAHKEQGIISPTKLAMSTRLSVSQAEEVLDQFERRNLAILTIGAGGTKVYEFPEFQTALSTEDDFMQRLSGGLDEDPRSVVHQEVGVGSREE